MMTPPFALGRRLVLGHGRCCQPQHVEGAYQVHLDDHPEAAQVMGRAIAAQDSPGPADPSAVDDGPQGAEGGRLLYGGGGGGLVGNVRLGKEGHLAQLPRQGLATGGIPVHDDDAGACPQQSAHGGLAQARGPSGDQSDDAVQLHISAHVVVSSGL